jgi:hypothetical protein
MFYRVVMNVIDMPPKIYLVSYLMFPIAVLPMHRFPVLAFGVRESIGVLVSFAARHAY